jgi:hypothetical protein
MIAIDKLFYHTKHHIMWCGGRTSWLLVTWNIFKTLANPLVRIKKRTTTILEKLFLLRIQQLLVCVSINNATPFTSRWQSRTWWCIVKELCCMSTTTTQYRGIVYFWLTQPNEQLWRNKKKSIEEYLCPVFLFKKYHDFKCIWIFILPVGDSWFPFQSFENQK